MMTSIRDHWRRGIGLGFALVALGVAWTSALWIRSYPDPDRLLALALADHAAGRDDEAWDSLAKLAGLREPTPADRMARAQIRGALGEEALPELALIPDDDPLAPAAHRLAGRVEVSRGRLRFAEPHFLAAIARNPQDPQPRRDLAFIYALQHRLRELDDQFTALSDRNQLDDKLLLIWARVRCGIWNPRSDLAPLEKAVAADPDDRLSRLALAGAYLLGNRIDDADRLLNWLPATDVEARIHRIGIAMNRGDKDAAEALLAGPEGSADHPRLLQLRGMLAFTHQDIPKAAENFRAALAQDPTDRATQFGLGTALKLMGRPDEATPHLEAAHSQDAVGELVRLAAVEKGSDDPTLARRLGIAWAKAGRRVEARGWLNLAIRQDPLDAEAQGALFDLDQPVAAADPTAR